MNVVKSKEFWLGVVAGVVLVKLVAPRLTGAPVVGGVAGKLS